MHNLLEILILTLRKFTKLPVLRYLDICNVLFGASLSEPRIHEVQEAVLYVYIYMFVG